MYLYFLNSCIYVCILYASRCIPSGVATKNGTSNATISAYLFRHVRAINLFLDILLQVLMLLTWLSSTIFDILFEGQPRSSLPLLLLTFRFDISQLFISVD